MGILADVRHVLVEEASLSQGGQVESGASVGAPDPFHSHGIVERQLGSTGGAHLLGILTGSNLSATGGNSYPGIHSILTPGPLDFPSPTEEVGEDGGTLHCGHGALMGPLGLMVQGLLAVIAFSALIVKRFCEPKPERRPWKIWFFDTSKQAIGAAVIHFANVFLAEIFHGDPCTWYIISFLLDSTVGLFIIYLGLKVSQILAQWRGWESLYFGEYGSPPQCSAWVGQCGVYILVMVIEKLLMTLLVLFDFWKNVRNFIMYPIKDPNLELVIVMFIVPFIVNAFIFWVVDNFLKKQVRKTTSVHASITNNDTALKYFKAMDKVKYYKKVRPEDGGSESDVLLSNDEDTPSESQYSGAGVENGKVTEDAEDFRLLVPTVT